MEKGGDCHGGEKGGGVAEHGSSQGGRAVGLI